MLDVVPLIEYALLSSPDCILSRLEKIAAPTGWTWSGDWVTDYSRGDDEGWEYAVNFDRSWHKSYGTTRTGVSPLMTIVLSDCLVLVVVGGRVYRGGRGG